MRCLGQMQWPGFHSQAALPWNALPRRALLSRSEYWSVFLPLTQPRISMRDCMCLQVFLASRATDAELASKKICVSSREQRIAMVVNSGANSTRRKICFRNVVDMGFAAANLLSFLSVS